MSKVLGRRGLMALVAGMALVAASGGCRVRPDAAPTGMRDAGSATAMHAAERVAGFLQPGERPDSTVLVPPPPEEGSAQFAADVEIYRSMQALRKTPRWELAAADANVKFPHAATTFECALGIPVTIEHTPNLYRILQRTVIDAGQSTAAAKDKYQRERPFARYDDPICVPGSDAALRKSGAYPSGHGSLGWAWALILAEISPDRSDAILTRGLEFGQSRVVCGVHWQSDVDAARIVAAAVYARLHANAEFVTQLAAAKSEVAAARARGDAPTIDCRAEAMALAAPGVSQ